VTLTVTASVGLLLFRSTISNKTNNTADATSTLGALNKLARIGYLRWPPGSFVPPLD